MKTLQSSRIVNAIELLLDNSKEMQDTIDRTFASPMAIASEICTIKVYTARHSGHSTAIAQFLLNRTDEHWAIISPCLSISMHNMNIINNNSIFTICGKKANIISRQTESKIEFYDGGSVITASKLSFDNVLRGVHLNGIIVDCASDFNKVTIDLLYRVGLGSMARNKYMYFIFVE